MSGDGKQYGLIKRPQKASSLLIKKSVFAAESDSDSDQPRSSQDWYKDAMRTASTGSVQAAQTRQVLRKAAEQDASIFQYDEVYETLQRTAPTTSTADSVGGVKKKPRYMDRLLETAERRKQEHERRVERKVQLEREKEGDEFADKESFVTEAYKQKLLERQKLEEDESRRRKQEEVYDVTKQKDLSGLYRHLLSGSDGRSRDIGEKVAITEEVGTAVSNQVMEPTNLDASGSVDSLTREKQPLKDISDNVSVKFNKGRLNSQTKFRQRHSSSEVSGDEKCERSRSHHGDSRSPQRSKRSLPLTSEPKGFSGDHRAGVRSKAGQDGCDSTGARPDSSPLNARHSHTDRNDNVTHGKSTDRKIASSDSDGQESAGATELPPVKPNGASLEKVLLKARLCTEEERTKRREKLFTKRTVGEVFDEALKRYLARKDQGPALVPIET